MIENNTGSFDIDNASYIRRDSSSGALEITSGSTTARNMIFNTKTNGAESARIDSSGNLLVGTTAESTWTSTAGHVIRPNSSITSTRDGGQPLIVNRLTSDGIIIDVRKDGSGVGSIGAEGGQIYIVNGDTGLKFAPSVDGIIPVNAGGANRDNAIDLGVGSVRFKDLYLSNAAYTTYVKGGSGHTGQMHFTGSHDIRFVNNGNERMRIDAGGSVLIGKSTPTDLHNTWNHLIIGEKGAIISENGGGGIDGISISDNAYIDSDTGAYAYQTTDEASIISQTGGNIIFSNAASGSAGAALSFSERMRITSAGNVGIGTSSPDTNLDVEGAGDCTISITAGSTSHDSKIDFVHGSTIDGGITYDHNGSYTSEKMAFRAGNNTPHMYLTGSGNVGIGTSSPTANLDIKRTGGDSDDIIRIGTTDNFYLGISRSNTTGAFSFQGNQTGFNNIILAPTSGSVSIGTTDTQPQNGGSAFKVESLSRRSLFMSQSGTGNANIIIFYSGGNLSGAINIASGSVSYGSGSDYRIKENIVDLTDATTRLKQLKPKRFNFITNPDDEARDGFLAHEVSSIVPEAVIGEKDAVDENGEIIVQQLDPSKLVPLLVKTIQELETRIVALENA
jgi:hypothetical protein